MSIFKTSLYYEIIELKSNDLADHPNNSDDIAIVDANDDLLLCTVCFKEFPSLIHLQRHYFVHIINKPYPCTKCEKSFFTETALQKHVKLHLNDKFYECEICERKILGRSLFKAHLNTHSFANLTCNACFQNFSTKQLLQQHERTHTSSRENNDLGYGCVLCEYCFILQRDLEDHMDEHEKVCLHTCKKCGKSFFYSYMLQKHLPKHKLQFFCNVCRESFDDKNRLHDHEKHHLLKQLDKNGILRFACQLCSVMFPHKIDLETHYNDTHETFYRYPCTMCYESFFFSFMLIRHKKTHMELKNIPCELCEMSFRTKSQLITHMKNRHLEKEFECPECGKTFTTKRLLLLHSVTHTTLKPFPCNVCGLAFKFKQNLDRHFLTHTDSKKFKCTQCDETFTRSTGLNNHMKLHNREPIACKECGKTYMSQNMLGKHIKRAHDGNTYARLYSCEFCGKETKHYSTHCIHMRQHTGVRPYKCKKCDRTFLQRPHLIAHHKIHHPHEKLVIELQFQCTYCNHSCLLEGGLRKHHARCHPSLEFKYEINSHHWK